MINCCYFQFSNFTKLHITGRANVFVNAAGMDAAFASLLWALLLLASSPDVLRRCHEEVDAVLGTSRLAKLSDRSQLPYCDATMHEVWRIGTVDPFGLPHRVTEDTPIMSYVIPKGTEILPKYSPTVLEINMRLQAIKTSLSQISPFPKFLGSSGRENTVVHCFMLCRNWPGEGVTRAVEAEFSKRSNHNLPRAQNQAINLHLPLTSDESSQFPNMTEEYLPICESFQGPFEEELYNQFHASCFSNMLFHQVCGPIFRRIFSRKRESTQTDPWESSREIFEQGPSTVDYKISEKGCSLSLKMPFRMF